MKIHDIEIPSVDDTISRAIARGWDNAANLYSLLEDVLVRIDRLEERMNATQPAAVTSVAELGKLDREVRDTHKEWLCLHDHTLLEQEKRIDELKPMIIEGALEKKRMAEQLDALEKRIEALAEKVY